MSNVRVGNGLWTARTSPVQIHVISPLMQQQQPDRDDHDPHLRAPLDRADHRLVDADAADERDERG